MLILVGALSAFAADPPPATPGGIGALFKADAYDGSPIVQQVLAGSPAEAAGLRVDPIPLFHRVDLACEQDP